MKINFDFIALRKWSEPRSSSLGHNDKRWVSCLLLNYIDKKMKNEKLTKFNDLMNWNFSTNSHKSQICFDSKHKKIIYYFRWNSFDIQRGNNIVNERIRKTSYDQKNNNNLFFCDFQIESKNECRKYLQFTRLFRFLFFLQKNSNLCLSARSNDESYLWLTFPA